ncbi:MAG: peptidylprolyl isomerase [Rhodospirillales bacterium]|jgi:peptidyl-prolyl cis-trans isomerase C|nr:peptidylprolyl isomerase [Rhodospirillales bacterium]MBT4041216.1 peptidylprolyl isomerase [Rhodospirillales bacterium]MBT4626878.1 peptidylprolyl isomerase [Rhodospirillales bacterium]MBT5350462.1 peptidylprolyl isomerase [Rhodospirillales bacterium]MBT5519680.1 peptidylprolyl isomerase [Rhodospirillales bacterium]
MTYRTIGVFFAAILGLMINAGHTMAQETADDQVVAVANGEPVYMSDVLRAASGLPEQYKNAPMDTLYPHLLERVIAMKLLAAQGEQLELDQTDEFEMQMEYVREQLLEKATLNQVVAAEITDDAVQERYQTSIASQPGGEEIRARHILLDDEAGAMDVISQLEGGADFAELAIAHSTGPSGPSGGDLGYFATGQMVPAFEQAAFALETGAFTKQPVKTQFGWHVIYLEDRRAAPAPSLSEVEAQLRNEMTREIEVDYVKALTAEATVERFNMDGTPMKELVQ